MKNKKIRLMIAIVFVLIAALAIWYFMPTTFLSKVNPSDIKSISVLWGRFNTGHPQIEKTALLPYAFNVRDFICVCRLYVILLGYV